MSPWSNRKPALGQRSTLIKHVTSMSYKLELAIWSRDTGQRIARFYRCQLFITWCHISKKYTVNQGSVSLSTYYLEYGLMLRDSTVAAISSPEFSGTSVSGGSPVTHRWPRSRRTLGSRLPSPPSCRRRAYAPTRDTTGHDNMRKSIHGLPLFKQ